MIKNRPQLSAEERKLPLAKYYDLPLYEMGPLQKELVERGCPVDNRLAVKAEDFLQLLEPEGYSDMEFGYSFMDDGSAYIAVYTMYPSCTPQMLSWYFRWVNTPSKNQPGGEMGYDNLRYKIWNPADHVGHGFVNGKDKSGGIWTVESLDLGCGDPKTYTIRHSLDPKDFGLTEEKEKELREAGCFVDFAYETFHTMDPSHTRLPGMHLCLTISRKNPLGFMEKRTREWIGYGIENGKIVRDVTTPGEMCSDAYLKKVITHCVIEAQQLAVFLPDLYREYKDKPEDAD